MTVGSLRRILTILTVVLIMISWPLGLFLHNRSADFLNYSLLTSLVALSFLLFRRLPGFWIAPLFAVPFLAPQLILFPSIAAMMALFWKRTRLNLFFLGLTVGLIILSYRQFLPHSIFTRDYNAQQAVLSQGYLYPTTWMSRLFQNKPGIYWQKAKFNLFALTDPNNYFFAFHPREITVDNQNLIKFPFLTIIFFLSGLFLLPKHPYLKFIAVTGTAAIFSLSLLRNFDRFDFILYVPLLLITLSGLNHLCKKFPKLKLPFLLLFLAFATTELMKILSRT